MSDPNVFAVLIPCDKTNLARDAFRLQDNADCYCKAVEGIAEEPTIDSREPTPAPQSSPEGNYDSADRVLLRLDKLPKDLKKGWQFGTDPLVSDVLLGHRGTKGISSHHFHIAITKQFRVELHEKSRYGTAVGYDGQAKEVVMKEDKWLLSFEPGAQKQWKYIIIYVPDADGLAFKIEFPNHRVGGRVYWANLWAFVEERKIAIPSVSGLGLNSNPSTAPLSRQPRTPHKRPIYLHDGEIGQGAFGQVRRVIDAREGNFYAAKKFKPLPPTRKNIKKRKLDEENWLEGIRNEIAIMKKNPHPNIMQVIDFEEKPEPLLLMPYYPRGNLEDLTGVKGPQYVSAFRQILLGLRHLHGRGVAHQDLKPENLLVADPFTILSDFGLSKFVATDGLLKSFCGTCLYAAPEVRLVNKKGYRPSVDIWSAGVIMLEFIFGRPDHADIDKLPLKEWIKTWSDILVKKVNDLDEDGDQVIDILKHMVRMEPKDRFTADQCLQRGCDNGLFRRRHDGRIVDIEIATSADSTSDDSTATPTQQSPQGTESGTSNASGAPTILAGDLWGSDESGRQESANSPSGQLTPTRGSNSGPPTRRQKMSHASSWSLTIGPENSELDGGFDLDIGRDRDGENVTGLFIRKDYFTASLSRVDLLLSISLRGG